MFCNFSSRISSRISTILPKLKLYKHDSKIHDGKNFVNKRVRHDEKVHGENSFLSFAASNKNLRKTIAKFIKSREFFFVFRQQDES